MLVWWKGNIKKTLSVLQYYVPLWWWSKVQAILTGRSTILGFDLAWFSSPSSKYLCILDRHGVIYIVNFFGYISFYLLVSWAWWDWPLTWLTYHRPSVLSHCWLGNTTCKIVSEAHIPSTPTSQVTADGQ